MNSFNFASRPQNIERLGEKVWDVLVVGGGVTGTGIARDATLRGLDTALIERDDFSIGTSSRSSNLVHGGLRYLKNGEFGLVHESTTERNLLTSKIAPNLVRPLPFLVPVWQDSSPGWGAMRAAMVMYDALAEFRNFRTHRSLSPKDLVKRAPLIRSTGLKGGYVYYDSVSDDTRLTLELAMDAANHGACVLNRVEAVNADFLTGRVQGLTVRDTIDGRELFVNARSVIVATGIWSTKTSVLLGLERSATLEIRPTRGSHIVLPYESFPIDSAVTMMAPQDRRAMFVIPWNGMTVIGTTDTDHQDDMRDVYATPDDVDYLLEAAKHNFPGLKATKNDIVGTWSGLRPLIASSGSESSVSREHSIVTDPRGIVNISGGKLTTYRVMADQALKAASKFFNKRLKRTMTQNVPLACATGIIDPDDRARLADEILNKAYLSASVADNLVTSHGVRAVETARLVVNNPALGRPIVKGHPWILAEIVQAVRNEMAVTLEDVLLRRTPVFFLDRDEDESITKAAADVMADECGWSKARKRTEIENIRAIRLKHLESLK